MSIASVHNVDASHSTSATFSGRYLESDVSKYKLSKKSLPAAAACQLIKDECLLDGNPTMNLASFVTTWMEDEANEIMLLGKNKNIADQEEYPASHEIQERCVNILAQMFNSPSKGPGGIAGDPDVPVDEAERIARAKEATFSVGTSTIGSSEAIMLAGLAMKFRWRQWRAAQKEKGKTPQMTNDKPQMGEKGTGTDVSQPTGAAEHDVGTLKGEGWATSALLAGQPYGPGSGEPPCNLIFSAAAHVSMLKTCKYLDIEPRIIPLEHGRYTLDPDLVMEQVDENTIGVMCILGNTLTGAFDPIKEINDRLIEYNKAHGTNIGIHVDGASGGFVVPFSKPELEWDFRLDRVKSINVSGHKFGLVYPGIGWIVWKDRTDLPEDLIFHINYLGADEPTYSLNFSKPAAHILLQYFVFLRLGEEGFKSIIRRDLDNAKYLATQLTKTGIFEIVSENLTKDEMTIPVVVFRIKPNPRLRRVLGFDERELVHELRSRGWIIPAYSLPAACSDTVLVRIVVRESLSHETCDLLLHDIKTKLVELMNRNADQEVKLRAILKSEVQAQLTDNGKEGASTTSSHQSFESEADKKLKSTSAIPQVAEVDEQLERERDELAQRVLGALQAQRPHSRIKTDTVHDATSGTVRDRSRSKSPNKTGQQAEETTSWTTTTSGGSTSSRSRVMASMHQKKDQVVGAVSAGLEKVGLHYNKEEPPIGEDGKPMKKSSFLKRGLETIRGKRSSVHTGATDSKDGGHKTGHITSVIC